MSTITIRIVEAARDHDRIVIRAMYGELNKEIKAQGNDTEGAKHNLALFFKAQYGDKTTVKFTVAGARNGHAHQGGDPEIV
jgi:hypothetical protein